jgi:formamidase
MSLIRKRSLGMGNSLGFLVALFSLSCTPGMDDSILELGTEGRHCGEDPHCVNRLHHAIPMVASADQGQTIVLHTRNASDFDLDPNSTYDDPRRPGGPVHPITGPVHINGAEAGDLLAVTLLDIEPGSYGYTSITSGGWVTDRFEERLRVVWELDRTSAVSDGLPGVRIPNASFPGLITTLPGAEQVQLILDREKQLAEAGGSVSLPNPENAYPAEVCGPEGSHWEECLRTFPPREHGGNLDIRHLGVGATIYLPCYVDGCGLAVGDLHYAQGDGEVAGTAIEMDATVTLTASVVEDGTISKRGPHYEGPSSLLDIPSGRFYATTGFPLKEVGEIPPDMEYLGSDKIAPLANLSLDLSLAARSALLEMIDYISKTYDKSREQAYIIASVAVDLRIGELVDAPNVAVTAILPLDIFEPPPLDGR